MIKKQYLKSKPICKTTFTLPVEAAPKASKVFLLGDFNNWDKKKAIPLKKQKNGIFKVVLDLSPGREYQFRYLIDNNIWENHWEADKYQPSGFGEENSVVVL